MKFLNRDKFEDAIDAVQSISKRSALIISGVIASMIMGFWTMKLIKPANGPCLIAAAVVALIFVSCVRLNDREIREHYASPDFGKVNLPYAMAGDPDDRMRIEAKLILGDEEVKFVSGWHKITKIGVYLKAIVVVLLFALLLLVPAFMGHRLPAQIDMWALIACVATVRYLFTNWRRRYVVVTKIRLLIIKDPAWPLRDVMTVYRIDKLLEAQLDKPRWAQWLPGKRIIQVVKIKELRADEDDWIILPLTTDPLRLHMDISNAVFPVDAPKAPPQWRHRRRGRRA
jgi:hypothetical protein